ncbi:MAG: YceI family protein [Flavobacteriales bacterium]|nr:YceI family protein [Flavobacteriales bacterium]
MRLHIVLVFFMLVCAEAAGQSLYTTDSSMVSFFSSTPVEDIEAVNEVGISMLNVAKSEVVFRIPMAGFQFEKPLMQEHFNENYMETEKFPHASFQGILSDSLDLSKDTVYAVSATGILKIHGVDHASMYSGTIESNAGVITLSCSFSVLLKDHDIKVPRVVFTNIAEEIEVKTFFRYKAYEKK